MGFGVWMVSQHCIRLCSAASGVRIAHDALRDRVRAGVHSSNQEHENIGKQKMAVMKTREHHGCLLGRDKEGACLLFLARMPLREAAVAQTKRWPTYVTAAAPQLWRHPPIYCKCSFDLRVDTRHSFLTDVPSAWASRARASSRMIAIWISPTLFPRESE